MYVRKTELHRLLSIVNFSELLFFLYYPFRQSIEFQVTHHVFAMQIWRQKNSHNNPLWNATNLIVERKMASRNANQPTNHPTCQHYFLSIKSAKKYMYFWTSKYSDFTTTIMNNRHKYNTSYMYI